MFVVCTDRDALIDTQNVFVKLMRFKNSSPFIEIVLLKLQLFLMKLIIQKNILHRMIYVISSGTIIFLNNVTI